MFSMFTRRPALAIAAAISIGAGSIAAACGGGEDGAPGATGLAGVAGPQGAPGAAGAPGAPGTGAVDGGNILGGACTTPCHTFGGVVDQWRFSNHSHPQENEVGGGPCGNCHALDGIAHRVANEYTIVPDAGAPTGVAHGHVNYKTGSGAVTEIGYAGATTIGQIHCTTCHDFNPTNDPHVTGRYVAGSARIRVPGAATDTVLLETSADASAPTGTSLSYNAGNVCVFCHKSRKDVTSFVAANNPISSNRWGPHNGPQSDVYSGKGGYQFAGQTYGSSAHAGLANACVSCHMGPVAANSNVPDHSMKPTVAFCKTCHTQYTGTDFDIQGGRTLVKNALFELQAALNAAGLLTRAAAAPYGPLEDADLADGQFNLDLSRPGSGAAGANQNLDAPTAGALYNYLILARSKDLGVHNPTYAKELLWDSIKQLTGANPTSLPARPQ
jgi:hypothetical protein